MTDEAKKLAHVLTPVNIRDQGLRQELVDGMAILIDAAIEAKVRDLLKPMLLTGERIFK